MTYANGSVLHMTGPELRSVREALGLSQVQCAQLLGVHPLTLSKWERGIGAIPTHQQAMVESFRAAKAKNETIGEDVAKLLITAGVVVAIFALLSTALNEKK